MKKTILLCLTFSLLSIAAIGSQVKKPTATPTVAISSHVLVSHRDFDEDLHKKCLYPSIRVTNTAATQRGSCVIVRSDKVGSSYHNVALTCRHCVDEMQNYDVNIPVYNQDGTTFENWKTYSAIVYASTPEFDMAVILFKTPHPVDVAEMDFKRKLCIGNSVSHIGCSEEPRLEDGRITSLNYKLGGSGLHLYRTSMHTIPGDSGGPAFYNNKVVGLMQSIRVTRFQGAPVMLPHISMMVPIGAVKAWDEKENNTLRFIYNPKAKLPRLPFRDLEHAALEWGTIEHEGK